MNSFLVNIIAMAPQAAEGSSQQGPGFWIGWFAIMIAIFYFILIRPQKRRETERKNLLSDIKNGDRVVFSGGIIGTVTNTKENLFVIRIAEKTKIEVARSAVSQVLEKGEEPSEESSTN